MPSLFSNRLSLTFVFACLGSFALAADLPDPAKVQPVQLLTVPSYCEGVVFDKEGKGYVSWGKTITQFTLDGKQRVWAETGAPNGHKILADGTHLVCDASQHAVLHLSADGKLLPNASKECDGKPLRGPNDLTLDTANGGFYFTDPADSGKEKPDGTVHYVDSKGKTHLIDSGYAFSNGIVLTPDGKKLYVGESQQNRVWVTKLSVLAKSIQRSCSLICRRKTKRLVKSTINQTECAWIKLEICMSLTTVCDKFKCLALKAS